MKYKLFLVFLCCMLLCSCGAKEPDDRDFVMIMGIDKDNDYTVSSSIAKLGSDNNELINYTTKGKTLEEAVDNLNRVTSGDIFLGDLQAVITNGKDMKEEIFRFLNDNMDVGRDIPVIECSSINKLMTFKNENIDLCNYIIQYFKNNKHKKVNLETYLNSNEKSKMPVLKILSNNYYIE